MIGVTCNGCSAKGSSQRERSPRVIPLLTYEAAVYDIFENAENLCTMRRKVLGFRLNSTSRENGIDQFLFDFEISFVCNLETASVIWVKGGRREEKQKQAAE